MYAEFQTRIIPHTESVILLSPVIRTPEESCLTVIYSLTSVDLTLNISLLRKRSPPLRVKPYKQHLFYNKMSTYKMTVPSGKYRIEIKVVKWNEVLSMVKQATLYSIDLQKGQCPIQGACYVCKEELQIKQLTYFICFQAMYS